MRILLIILVLVLAGLFVYWFVPIIPADSPTPIDQEPQQQEKQKESNIASDKGEILIMEFPRRQDKISSPLAVKGQASGTWFFEASFPVVLTNWDGLIIGQGIAQAQGEWMTQEYVPFAATLIFEKPDYGENGFLILQKDNPSGLPEHDDAVEIPILFE